MAGNGKRLSKAREGLDREKLYGLEEAVNLVKSRAAAKFDETVELGPSGTVPDGPSNNAQWDTLTVSWTATAAEAGQFLGIAFGVIDNADGIQSEFDNVRLDAVAAPVAIPEPSTAALLGLGGLALVLRRRK